MSTAIKPSGLFELTAEMTALIDEITANDGVLTDETEAALKRLTESLGAKVDDYGNLLQTLDLQCIGYRDRAKAMLAAVRARESAAERIKARLVEAMQQMGTRKLVGEIYQVRIGTAEAVKIDDLTQIPAAFWRQPEAPPAEPAKDAIKKALKANETVPGASLTRNPYLVIS